MFKVHALGGERSDDCFEPVADIPSNRSCLVGSGIRRLIDKHRRGTAPVGQEIREVDTGSALVNRLTASMYG
jgi:hypothetical protein